jgi:hypothetical protein
VSVAPGEMRCTLMASLRSSICSAAVKPSSPHLAAQFAVLLSSPTLPAREPISQRAARRWLGPCPAWPR